MGASFHVKQFQEIQKYQVLLKFESIKMVATLHADFNHRNQSSVMHPVASVYIGSHFPQRGELIAHKTLIFVYF